MELDYILTPFSIFGTPVEKIFFLNYGDFDPLLRSAKFETGIIYIHELKALPFYFPTMPKVIT